MKTRQYLRIYAYGISGLLLAAALMVGGTAGAQNETPWPVTGKLFGQEDEKAEDVSGIACASASGFPRSCLLVDDESQGAQVVIVKDGEVVAGQFIPLINDTFDNEPLELDAEGVVYAGDAFYVIGSHGHPRDKDKELDRVRDAAKIAASIKANSQVIRVRIAPATIAGDGKLTAAPDIKPSAELGKLLAADSTLKPFIGKRLDENGLTVEGVAVREGRLYVGMRGPSISTNQAAILSVSLGAVFDGAAPDAKLHLLGLGGGRGVRDLVAFENGFLVLAGPTAETEGPYAIYSWDGRDATKLLKDLPKYTGKKSKQIKPEAMLPLDRNAEGLRVLVLFDGAKEGTPRPIRIPYP